MSERKNQFCTDDCKFINDPLISTCVEDCHRSKSNQVDPYRVNLGGELMTVVAESDWWLFCVRDNGKQQLLPKNSKLI